MRFFEQTVGDNGARLSAYLHDLSVELPNAARRPAVLVFPGGGYVGCSDREAEPIALAYMAEGYNAFVLRYTTGRDNPDTPTLALEDAQAALAALRSGAEEWNLAPGRVAVVGFSAGGHLATALGTLSLNKPDAMILGYPAVVPYMLERLGMTGPSVIDAVSADTPPAFIFHTRNDQVVPIDNTLVLATALEAAGVEFEAHIFRDGPHGFSLAKPLTSSGQAKFANPIVARWFGMSVDWLHEIWGDFPADIDVATGTPGTFLGLMYSPLGVLQLREDIWADIQAELPAVAAAASQMEMVREMTLAQMAGHAPEAIPADVLARLQEKYAE